MSDTPVPPPEADAAERRAAELLALLATREPHVGEQFTPDLVTRARAQKAVAGPLRAAGWFLAAVAGAFYAALVTEQRKP